MALSMDSVRLTPAELVPSGAGAPVDAAPAPPMPGYAPLAMPAQSFRRFSRSERRAWINPRLARSPILARLVTFGGALALTAYGAFEMYKVVGVGTPTALEWVMVVLFVITFSWVALSFTASLVGFVWLLVNGRKRDRLPDSLAERTAVVMPIYNEAPSRVFAAMQAIIEDVERTGLGGAFDYFFLSDTTDGDVWIAEERAFLAMRERLPGAADLLPAPAQEHEPQGRQHRRLRHPLGRPLRAHAGARRRQRHVGRRDRAARRGDGGRSGRGIIQTLPLIINRNTLFARLQQFAARIAGPVIAAGLDRVDGAGRQLLGPQRDHPHARLRRPLRPARPAGPAAVRRPHPQPRFRRGGADPARRLRRLHAADARRLLRGEPAVADRPRRARPALVPGQPAARAHHRGARLRLADPPAFRDRHHGLSGVAACGWPSCWSASSLVLQTALYPARIFHRRFLAVSRLAAVRLRARAATLHPDDRRSCSRRNSSA